MQLRFTKRARHEFLRIVDIYVEYAGQRAADKFIDKTKACGEAILKYPTAGHPEPLLLGNKKLYRAKSITENYRIIYHVTNTTIWVDDIWDRRRDPSKLTNRLL